jgi:hypothetical protein
MSDERSNILKAAGGGGKVKHCSGGMSRSGQCLGRKRDTIGWPEGKSTDCRVPFNAQEEKVLVAKMRQWHFRPKYFKSERNASKYECDL